MIGVGKIICQECSEIKTIITCDNIVNVNPSDITPINDILATISEMSQDIKLKISNEKLVTRRKIIEWINQVSKILDLNDDSFFLTVEIIAFFIENLSKQVNRSLVLNAVY